MVLQSTCRETDSCGWKPSLQGRRESILSKDTHISYMLDSCELLEW